MDAPMPPTGPTTILLVRHAQSEWNATHRWQGQADPPLSPVGLHQAARLADHPSLAAGQAIVASDLQRARVTAEAIAARRNLQVTPEPLLRELDVGSWSGLTRDEIERDQPGAIDRYRAGMTSWEGGETFAEHAARTRTAAARLAAWPDVDTLVAVTHGGTIRMLVAALLGMDDDGRARFAGQPHASVTELRRAAHGWQLAAYGA